MTDSHQYSPLDASVLVLNKLFMAVHVINVKRAFCLLFKDMAEVVTLEDGQYVTYDFATWREVSEFKAKMVELGSLPGGPTPAEFSARFQRDIKESGETIRRLGMTAD